MLDSARFTHPNHTNVILSGAKNLATKSLTAKDLGHI